MAKSRRNLLLAMALAGGVMALASGCTPEVDLNDNSADPSLWPAADSPAAITSPQVEAEIDALLRRMTLEQKVGQLIQADISSIKPEDLLTYPLGSILAGGNSGPYGNERADAQSWARLVSAFRSASEKSGAGIPILFGVDAVHGHSNLPGATLFPHNIGLGAANDAEMMERIGAATAAEISGSGIEWTFAPTLAVPQDMRWGRTYEGYGADPALVARYARAMTLGLQGSLVEGQPLPAHRVAATAKHFLADGGTADGRDQGDARISESELIAKHAQGYPAAINAGALTIMASFSSWNGAKHHGNATLLTDVLKQRMGFDGLVVGDWNGHGQIPGCAPSDCPQAINAGLDLFMAPDSWKGVYASTLAAAKSGKIPMSRIDDAVRRILRVKYKLGLMGEARVQRGDVSKIATQAHLDLAREAVAKSLVLLKNNDGVLPVRNGAKVLITGPGADNMAMQAGGWTISWQGGDTRAEDFPKGQTIGKALAEAVTAQGGTAQLASGTTAADSGEKADVAIIVVGERPYAEFEGDVPHLAFKVDPAVEQMIAKLKARGTRVVVLFLSGRPMFTGRLINQADAFVAGWLPGSQGQGVADVLVAGAGNKPRRDFTGRLPFAWPADARSPITRPLFPVGHGLNYASRTKLAPVNEKPGVDISGSGQASQFILRGKVPAPWHLGIDGAISTRAVDLSAQEDAREFRWNADSSFAVNGPQVDVSKALAAGSDFVIEWRIDKAASGPIALSFGEATLDVSEMVRAAAPKAVTRTAIPLRCFAAAGTKMNAVGSPLRLKAPKGFTATIRFAGIASGNSKAKCPAKAQTK